MNPSSLNPFRQAIRARRQQIGLWQMFCDPAAIEITATAGFDWILIDGEHAPNDLRTILSQLQALNGSSSHPIVRPVNGDSDVIKQLLDIGAHTLLVPMVHTAEDARRIVRAAHYPPRGIRGMASGAVRASRWGMDASYIADASEKICILVQAESVEAIRNLDEICAVEGVDGVFIGPADLSASMGHTGNPYHPDVRRAIDDALARIENHGKASGFLITRDEDMAHFVGRGTDFVAVGLDVLVYAQAARALQKATDQLRTRATKHARE